MSINGPNSNQILTLMQLESGKSYKFVGTTGNYSDYMCVTAGMFELPKKEYSRYKIIIALNFTSNITFYVSLPGYQEYSWDIPNSYLGPANMSDSLEELRNWTTYFKNNGTYLFSFTPTEQYAFTPIDMVQTEALLFGFNNRYNDYGAPTIYSNGIQQTVGQEASLMLGTNPNSIPSYYQELTKTTENAQFIFNYPLHINTGADSFESYGTILTGLNGGNFDYIRDIEFLFSLKFDNFYADPKVYDGQAPFSHSSTYSESGTEITRTIKINLTNNLYFRTC